MLKKCIILIGIVLPSSILAAQGIVAGQWNAGDLHVDAITDTVINAGGPPNYSIVDDALWDVDGDSNPDVVIEGFNFVFAPVLQQKSTDARTLGATTEIAYDFVDTCWSEQDINGDTSVAHIKWMIKIFEENDVIDNSVLWSGNDLYWSYYDFNSSPDPDINCGYTSPYQNDTAFIGIRFFSSGDTLYGWMKFAQPTYHSIKILEWAFQDANVGVVELSSSPLKIYPNPVRDVMWIHQQGHSENLTVEICNAQGKFIGEYVIQKDIPVDVSDLDAGFYYIRIHQPGAGCVKFIKL